MKITIDDQKPIEYFPYVEVSSESSQSGQPILLQQRLPIFTGEFEKKGSEIDFLIICSDLQGMVDKKERYQLLGEELPAFLKMLLELELNADDNSQVGVLLCGDFFTSLEKRGSSGDVRKVWEKFEDQFKWVIGVAGNHDRFGTAEEKEIFKSKDNISLLHLETKTIDSLKIGGISGIIGRADKINRVEESQYLLQLKKLLKQNLDFILLHETPDYPPFGFIGNEKIRQTIEAGEPATICCGHCYWEKTQVKFENNSQIINVDSKVVILKNKNIK